MNALIALAVGAAIGLVHGVGERSFSFGLKVAVFSGVVAFVFLSVGL